jgi:hypothetical protein
MRGCGDVMKAEPTPTKSLLTDAAGHHPGATVAPICRELCLVEQGGYVQAVVR